MRMAVNCPYCKRPMATSAAFAGQTIACPNCRGEFVFQPPASTPPDATGTDMLPPGAARLQLNAVAEHGPSLPSSATAVASPLRELPRSPTANVALPPAPGPPPAPANVARFKTAASITTTIAP